MVRIRRRRKLSVGWVAILLLVLAVLGMTWMNNSDFFAAAVPEEGQQAISVVRQFYAAEQSGDFGSSWELFHPLMQERFDKAGYIQMRARLMMQDIGVKTFDFTIGEEKQLASWKMDDQSEELSNVVQVEVTLSFRGQYGVFQWVQPCFVAEADGRHGLLWSFSDAGADSAIGSIPAQK
ncbi:hypothetical protein [Paenibacillus sp. GCM10027626]|uniref:hypothetical protein n=1 Tax=Paenibacillus sp. GCM10027626 TaxID=3273411 RepID=UPI003633F439